MLLVATDTGIDTVPSQIRYPFETQQQCTKAGNRILDTHTDSRYYFTCVKIHQKVVPN